MGLQIRVGVALVLSAVTWPDAALAASDPPFASLKSGAEAEALRARIDRDAAALAKSLTPEGRKAYLASLQRLHYYASAHCGFHRGQKLLAPGEDTCLLNIYGNFLYTLPGSIYRIGPWRVYETGVYGIEWADDSLLGQDPERPFWWDLEVTWPRVDADPSPVPPLATLALTRRVDGRLAAWVSGGWSLHVDVHFAAINDCHIAATIEESAYTGGAHPNENTTVFNWNRAARRELQPDDLFIAGRDWHVGLLQLYRRHLAAGAGASVAASVADDDLAPWVDHGWVVTDKGLRIVGHWGNSRTESLPAEDIPWSELGDWLLPGVACGPP